MSQTLSPAIDEHRRFMLQALLEAEKALRLNEVPVGAVIVHDGLIIGRGYNQVETLNDPTAHAEIIAITSACATLENKYLTGCTLYVTLEPCSMCAGALIWSKMDRLVFGATDEKAGACGSILNIAQNKSLNHHVEIIQGVLELDASELLKQFFKSRRKLSNI
jgi:tRNA(adenine34) deaminase